MKRTKNKTIKETTIESAIKIAINRHNGIYKEEQSDMRKHLNSLSDEELIEDLIANDMEELSNEFKIEKMKIYDTIILDNHYHITKQTDSKYNLDYIDATDNETIALNESIDAIHTLIKESKEGLLGIYPK